MRFGYDRLLHFLQPNAYGLVEDISIKGLAELVGCTPATIRASNLALFEYGYCYVCESLRYDGCINIIEYRLVIKISCE